MNKEEFLGKLQMCYFGDKNAFDEIVGEFNRLNNIINELEKYLQSELEREKDIKGRAITEVAVLNSIIIEGTLEQILARLKELKGGK